MKILILLYLCTISFWTIGQETVRSIEFEIGGGCSLAAKNNRTIGAGQFLLELRNNYSAKKFDWGVQFCVTGTMGNKITNEGTPTGKIEETGTYLLPVFDYNFRQGKKISYFIGSGLGMMMSRLSILSRVDNIHTTSVCVMPRVGIEAFNHLRLTLDYKWNWRGEYNYGSISVGFVVGGGRLK